MQMLLTKQVKLVREGKAATVTVIDQADPRKGTYRDMYLNGVEEASTRYWHVQLFKLLGVLPPLIHEGDGPKEAMVIAFGAGITAGSVLAMGITTRTPALSAAPAAAPPPALCPAMATRVMSERWGRSPTPSSS